MNDKHLRHAARLCLLLGPLWFACRGGERANPLIDEPPPNTDNLGNGGRSGAGAGGSGGDGLDAGVDASVEEVPRNCGDITCRGAGQCSVDAGVAACVCDDGYVLTAGECVVDETCINLRLLEKGCRQRVETEPALGMFFGLETCAGTTVRPDILGDVTRAFKVIEDDNELGEESYATVLERDVESYVALAIDLSGSLVNDQNLLVPLLGELRSMVQSLEPGLGEPPVSIALIVFGRSVHVLRPFTNDFALVLSTLDAIQADPAGAITEPGGTNLIGAVNDGIEAITTALDARFQETLGGVVATGTLVTITDGRDTAGVTTIANHDRINLISIGISGDIDDEELTRIGPQGSFLAPEPDDWSPAFDRVAQRVSEYPDRSYLLGYCSPAVAGTHRVKVTLDQRETKSQATCRFDAEDFGVGVGTCNAGFIGGYCADRSCGSFLACGLCGADGGAPTEQAPDDQWQFAEREP